MAIEEKPAAKGTIATVVATAAVTLAIGITAAAFAGYLVPGGDVNEKQTTEITEPAVEEARPVVQRSAPNVVLVPVAPDLATVPAATPARSSDEVVIAAYEPRADDEGDDDDHRRRRKHHDREHEDDDDDRHDKD